MIQPSASSRFLSWDLQLGCDYQRQSSLPWLLLYPERMLIGYFENASISSTLVLKKIPLSHHSFYNISSNNGDDFYLCSLILRNSFTIHN